MHQNKDLDLKKRKEESNIRHIKDIMDKPLNQLRTDLSSKFLSLEYKKNITESYVRDLFSKLEPLFLELPDGKETFSAHMENFEHMLSTGDIKRPINLQTEESQFFWGIALTYLACNPKIQQKWEEKHRFNKISKSTLWRRIEKSQYMKNYFNFFSTNSSCFLDFLSYFFKVNFSG